MSNANLEFLIEQKIGVTNAILLRIERILIEIRDGKNGQPGTSPG